MLLRVTDTVERNECRNQTEFFIICPQWSMSEKIFASKTCLNNRIYVSIQ